MPSHLTPSRTIGHTWRLPRASSRGNNDSPKPLWHIAKLSGYARMLLRGIFLSKRMQILQA